MTTIVARQAQGILSNDKVQLALVAGGGYILYKFFTNPIVEDLNKGLEKTYDALKDTTENAIGAGLDAVNLLEDVVDGDVDLNDPIQTSKILEQQKHSSNWVEKAAFGIGDALTGGQASMLASIEERRQIIASELGEDFSNWSLEYGPYYNQNVVCDIAWNKWLEGVETPYGGLPDVVAKVCKEFNENPPWKGKYRNLTITYQFDMKNSAWGEKVRVFKNGTEVMQPLNVDQVCSIAQHCLKEVPSYKEWSDGPGNNWPGEQVIEDIIDWLTGLEVKNWGTCVRMDAWLRPLGIDWRRDWVGDELKLGFRNRNKSPLPPYRTG